MAGKNADATGASKEGNISRLIEEVMKGCGCEGAVGFTTEELTVKLGVSSTTARRLLKKHMASGEIARGKATFVESISGVKKPSPTYIWVA